MLLPPSLRDQLAIPKTAVLKPSRPDPDPLTPLEHSANHDSFASMTEMGTVNIRRTCKQRRLNIHREAAILAAILIISTIVGVVAGAQFHSVDVGFAIGTGSLAILTALQAICSRSVQHACVTSAREKSSAQLDSSRECV